MLIVARSDLMVVCCELINRYVLTSKSRLIGSVVMCSYIMWWSNEAGIWKLVAIWRETTEHNEEDRPEKTNERVNVQHCTLLNQAKANVQHENSRTKRNNLRKIHFQFIHKSLLVVGHVAHSHLARSVYFEKILVMFFFRWFFWRCVIVGLVIGDICVISQR